MNGDGGKYHAKNGGNSAIKDSSTIMRKPLPDPNRENKLHNPIQ